MKGSQTRWRSDELRARQGTAGDQGTSGGVRRPGGGATRRRMGPRGTLSGGGLREAGWGRVYGAVRPGGVWRRRNRFPLLRVADRGDQSGRRRGGGDARGTHERG